MKGGKREGAGRKPSVDPASKMTTMRLTPTQHAKYRELGGSRWVKRLIDGLGITPIRTNAQ